MELRLLNRWNDHRFGKLLIWRPMDFLMLNFADLVGWMKERIYREVPPLLER